MTLYVSMSLSPTHGLAPDIKALCCLDHGLLVGTVKAAVDKPLHLLSLRGGVS